MKRNENSKKNEQAAAWTTALFLGFLGLFTALGILLPSRSFSPEENRYLAEKPKFQLKTLLDGSYGKAYETYLSDQFPLRTRLVAAKVNAERLMMREDVNGVYFGNDGYYIEKFEPEDLMTEQLEKNVTFLAQAARTFTEQFGEEHVKMMLVPSASQILTDKLPLFAAPADQGMVIGQVKEQLAGTAVLLDAEKALKAHKEEPVYYKTDHHWTTLGAYYGYRLYAESLGLKPLELEHFEKETATEHFYGTIKAKVNVSMKPDSIILYRPRTETYGVFYDGLSEEHPSLFNESALEGRDQYAVFLDGNHGWTKIVKRDDKKEERRLLIIKDSYAHCFTPFVAAHFDEVHMVDLRYFNMRLSEFAEEQKITDVLVLYQIPGFAKDQNIFKLIR